MGFGIKSIKKAVKKVGNAVEGSVKGVINNPLETLMLGPGVTSALGALDGSGLMKPPSLPSGPSGDGQMQGVPQLPGVAPQRQDNSALIQQLMGGQRMAPQQFMQQMNQMPGAPVPAKPLPMMAGGGATTQIQPPQPGNFMPMPQGQPNPAALAAILQGKV